MQELNSSFNTHISARTSHNSSLRSSVYTNLLIYYFSGTGNAKNAAQWIIDFARSYNISTHFINIDRFEDILIPDLDEGKTLLGFCFPTHGFFPAPLMFKFISLFPSIPSCDVFILNTRAGLKLSKLFIPGLSGLAQFLPALILKLKGHNVVGMQPLDLPSNWISLHPGVKEKVKVSIYKRCKRIVYRFSEKLLSGERIYKAMLSTPFDLAVSPISVGYYLIGRYTIAKTFIATDKCTNCGRCIEQCPARAIRLVNNRPFWSFNCESCMRCMNNCPERAIETAHSYTILIWYLGLAFVAPFITYKVLKGNIFGFGHYSAFESFLYSILEWYIFLVVLLFAYRILHYLLGNKIINKIISYTSLTSYKFWRRYKPPENY